MYSLLSAHAFISISSLCKDFLVIMSLEIKLKALILSTHNLSFVEK